MARIAVIGFEDQVIGATGQRWNTATGSPTITTTSGEFRSGAAALKITCPSVANWVRRTFTGGTEATMRAYLKIDTLPATAACTLIQFSDGNGKAFQLRLSTAGVIHGFISGGTNINGPTLSTGVWYRLDFKARTIGALSDVTFSVDGANETTGGLSLSASTFVNYSLGNTQAGPSAGTYFLDDIEVDDADVYPIGPGKVLQLLPTGRGTDAQGSGAFQNDASAAITGGDTSYDRIDELASVSGTDYIKQTVIDSNGYVEYTMADVVAGLGCNAVSVWAHTGGLSAAAHTSQLKFTDGTNVHGTAVTTGGSTTDIYTYTTLPTAPDGTAWDPADVNNLRIRWGYSTDITPNPTLKHLSIEAGFVEQEVETLALTATATPIFSSEVVGQETINLSATASLVFSSQVVAQETLVCAANAPPTLSAETYVPVSGSPYIESLALTATATPALSAQSFIYAPELLTGALLTATPILSQEASVSVETVIAAAVATPTLSGEVFLGGSVYTESLALTATATPVVPTETFIDISGSPVFDSTSILTCAVDTVYASKITVAEAGLAIRGNVYLDGLGSAATGSVGKMKMVLYDVDGSGFPRTLVATGAERTITKGQTAIWVQSDFGNPPIPAGDYWLGFQIGGTANVMRFHRGTLATGNRWTTDTYTDGPNTTWAFDGTKVGGYKFSVYLESSITTVTGTAYTDSARIANATATPILAAEIFDAGSTSGQPAGFHGIVERTGSATSGVTSSVTVHAARPWTKGVAIAAGWQDLEPNYRAYVWPTAWENSFIDACDNGYKIIPRIFSGDAAPDWLFTGANSVRGGNPATQTVYLISVEGQGARYVPVPWDPTLRLHYTALLDWLNTKLNSPMPGGRPGTYADYVIAVPITLPTTQGSEMPQAYGSGSWTGVYKGVSGTWDLQSNNKREWLSVASSGTTDAEKQASTIQDLGDAWAAAVLLHVGHLTNVHSSLAVGGLFTDNQARAIEITNSAVWTTYKDKLECYSTNLRTNPNSPYTWRSWNPKTAMCYDHVNAINGICANQTASDSNIGPDPVPGKTGDQADPFKRSLIEARDDFNSYYIEITTSKATAYQTWLRDVFQPTLIPSSSSSTSEIISLTANASPSLSAESVTAAGSFIETRVLAATTTMTLPSEVYDGADLLQLNIPATLVLSKEGGLMIETLFLTATSALSSIVSERMVQVELLTLALTQVLSLSKEDAGFPLPPYDMYLDVGIFDVSYNVQIQSNDQNVEIANYNLTVEV